jgi:hypothetical protein
METIDITPTREGFIYMLRLIITNSTNKKDVEWAKSEMARCYPEEKV